MKLIENKKIFGIVNIFDICILLLFLICVFFAYRYLSRGNSIFINTVKKQFTISIRNVKREVGDCINVGDKIYDNEINKYIGNVVSFEVSKSKVITKNYEIEEFVEIESDEYIDIKMVVEADLKENNDGFKTVDDYDIIAGEEISLRGPNYSSNGHIISFER